MVVGNVNGTPGRCRKSWSERSCLNHGSGTRISTLRWRCGRIEKKTGWEDWTLIYYIYLYMNGVYFYGQQIGPIGIYTRCHGCDLGIGCDIFLLFVCFRCENSLWNRFFSLRMATLKTHHNPPAKPMCLLFTSMTGGQVWQRFNRHHGKDSNHRAFSWNHARFLKQICAFGLHVLYRISIYIYFFFYL